MISYHVLQSRLSVRNYVNYRKRLTPFGYRIHCFVTGIWPFVSKRRYVKLRLERSRLIHEMHLMAVEMNRLERLAK